jgi:uncharacterized protein (DUF1697 family)
LTTYLAFMRAINVAGHAIVKMTDLKETFTAAGCKNVRTYIQSGNIVFDCPEERANGIFKKTQAQVRNLIGAEPEILFRTLSDMQDIVKAAPFKDLATERLIKLYVVFLSEKPKIKPKLPLAFAKEELEATGMRNLEVFVVSRRKPNGFYGFPNAFIEKEFGVSATSRNWSTVTKIIEFAQRET